MINEDRLENLCLEWFSDSGWEVACGPDIAVDGVRPERKDYKSVVLEGRLRGALERINPAIPTDGIDQAMAKLLKPELLNLLEGNRGFHRMLTDGILVEYKVEDELKQDLVRVANFQETNQNDFLVVNQFTLIGERRERRPDLVCFLNGLPIGVIELKNPVNEKTGINEAFNQIQTYKEELPDLFYYNEMLVISDGLKAKVGSLSANLERFQPWRTLKNEKDKPRFEWELETLVKGFFDRELLLDYLRYFILFESDGGLIKKTAGYHQFHAVRAAVKATIIASKDPEGNHQGIAEERANYGEKVTPGSKKAGVVWHTQGSGKSISMVCYGAKLTAQPEMKNPTLLVVTDRSDLDGQLFHTFSLSHDLLRQTPTQVNSRQELREELEKRQAGGILFTTVQKFALREDEHEHPILNQRHNIVVISDEAHRSQYGFKGEMSQTSGQIKYGYAQYLRDSLPNASFIGFTGTPIANEDRSTRAVFGDYVSIYDIQDAVDDGATVPIYYEARLARLNLNLSDIESLSEEVDSILEDEETTALKEEQKGNWTRLEKLVGAEPRLKEVAHDLVEHFEKRQTTMAGKGMIVGMSRDICVRLYDEIIKLRPEWHEEDPEKGAIKIVMTGSASDKEEFRPHIYSKATRKRLETRFKDPKDPLNLVIVRDMWLTGFDAPCCNTMYVDKPMKGHNLMQAIARVNRVFKDKPGGLVVDYIGIASELKKALKTYTDSQGRGEATLDIEQAYKLFVETMEIARQLFQEPVDGQSFDYSTYPDKDQAIKILLPAANHIVGVMPDGKKRFYDTVLKARQAFSLCGTLEKVKPLRPELAFFEGVRSVIAQESREDEGGIKRDVDSLLKRILDNSILSEGVDDIFALAKISKPDIGLLSEEFLEEVRQMPYRNMAVELLQKLIQDNIRSRLGRNLIKEKKFSDRLAETLRKYHNRTIESAQIIEELIAMANEMRDNAQKRAEMGLTLQEEAFYDALAENESAVRELGDPILQKIALEITESLRRSVTIDWKKRDSVKAKIRLAVRRILGKYKYPPDKVDKAVELVMEQANRVCDEMSHDL